MATAWEPHEPERIQGDFARWRASTEAALRGEWSQPARDNGTAPETLLVDGRPDLLLTAATAENAGLLVVGTRGSSEPKEGPGGLVHHLIRHADLPLAVVPATAELTAPTTIVLGVDGGSASDAAVAWCAHIAPRLGANIVAVFAWEPYLEWVPSDDPNSWRRDAERRITQWVAPITARQVAVEVVVVRDIHAAAALTAAAVQQAAQLIVVGAHQHGPFFGVRRGGIGAQLVDQQEFPVLMVPAQIV